MSEQDVIFVHGLQLEVLIGFHDWERAAPQKIRVDLEIYSDTSAASKSDSVKDSYDYEKIIERIREVAQQESFQLVERLASRIAEIVLDEFAVPRLKVSVAKLHAVPETDSVGVMIERQRARD